jgi:beta-lactamase regulating signal transducer with metallopeptidase domain
MILFASHDWWRLAGWTMLHYLWVGAALGLAAFAARRAVQGFSPQIRYGVAVACLALIAAAPIGIVCYLIERGQANDGASPIATNAVHQNRPAQISIAPSLPSYLVQATPSATGVRENSSVDAAAVTARLRELFDRVARSLPWAWLIGTPVVLLFVMSGLYGAERMRMGARLVVDGPTAMAFERAASSIGLARSVALAVSDRVVSPLVLGIFKPMVLLPAAALAGWSPAQLEMILLHELAHVRRWDNLVNLLQRIVESLLFYQPAVWLVSNWVRLEREHCCDAAVLACGNEPQEYAETLASLAMPGISPRYAAAALASHQLVSRIRHILQVEDRSMKLSRKTLLTVGGFSLIVCSLVAAYANQQADSPAQATAPADADKNADNPARDSNSPASNLTPAKTADQPASTAETSAGSATETEAPAAPTGEGWVIQLGSLHYHQDYRRAEVERLQSRVQALEEFTATLRDKVNLISGGKGEQMLKTAEGELAAAQNELARAQASLEQALTQAQTAQQQATDLAQPTDAAILVQTLTDAQYVDDLLLHFSREGEETSGKLDWSAEQLTGAPDAQAGADDRRAWASATADGQGEWIEVSYEQPVHAVAVLIFETHNPGAIGSVKVFESEDKWYWALDSRPARPIAKNSQVTTITLSGERPINKVRITIESVSVPGYNQIDAVGLLDPKGQIHWANSATASSAWRQPHDPQRENYDQAVARAINYIKQTHTCSREFPKLANCRDCHDTKAASEQHALDPDRVLATKWLAQSLLREAQTPGESAVVQAWDDSSTNQREDRLTKLRQEVETMGRELARIQEEFDLEKQRTQQREQLQQLRRELEQMRSAPKQSNDPTQPKQ